MKAKIARSRFRRSTLERLQMALLKRQRRLLEQGGLESAREVARVNNESADIIDIAAELSDKEVAFWSLDYKSGELNEIQTAFEKMREGTYGVCEMCEGDIRASRLRVLPSARFCVRCQQRHEREVDSNEPYADWSDAHVSYEDTTSHPNIRGSSRY